MSTPPASPPSRSGHPGASCAVCGSPELTSGRLSASEHERIDLFACDRCGEFWFEREGARLTAEAMRSLGLLP